MVDWKYSTPVKPSGMAATLSRHCVAPVFSSGLFAGGAGPMMGQPVASTWMPQPTVVAGVWPTTGCPVQ